MRTLSLIALLCVASCTRPLPEEGSAAAELYRARCGTSCHRAYQPSATRFATWEMIFPNMEKHIARSGQKPLTEEERRVILGYLRKHSG